MRAFFAICILGLWGVSGGNAGALSTAAPPKVNFIPIHEEISGLEALIASAPENIYYHYRLAWVNQRIYALNPIFSNSLVRINERNLWRYSNHFLYPVTQASIVPAVSSERLEALTKSIAGMRMVVDLKPESAHGWLGLGYSYAMASKRCNDVGWSTDWLEGFEKRLSGRQAVRYWRDESLKAYRQAMAVSEAESETYYWGVRGICQQLVEDTGLTVAEDDELAELSTHFRHFPRLDDFRGVDRLPGYKPFAPMEFVVEMEERFPMVPVNDNGAEYFLLAGDAYMSIPDYQALPFIGQVQLEIPVTVLSAETVQQARLLLRANKESLRLIRLGAEFSEFQYDYVFGDGVAIALDELSMLRGLSRLVLLDGLMAAEDGRTDDVQVALLDSLALGESLSDGPFTIGYSVHIAIGGADLPDDGASDESNGDEFGRVAFGTASYG